MSKVTKKQQQRITQMHHKVVDAVKGLSIEDRSILDAALSKGKAHLTIEEKGKGKLIQLSLSSRNIARLILDDLKNGETTPSDSQQSIQTDQPSISEGEKLD